MASSDSTRLDIAKLADLTGSELGRSSWHEITQGLVNGFADLTDDHQWIHVDVERAKASSWGGTIAHGYLVLCLGPALLNEFFGFDHFSAVLNYGLNRLRFIAPVRVGARIRLIATVAGVEPATEGATLRLNLTFESDGSDKPACVAEILFRVVD